METKNFMYVKAYWFAYGSSAKFLCDVLFPNGEIIANANIQHDSGSTLGICINIHGWESYIHGGEVNQLQFRFIVISKGSHVCCTKITNGKLSSETITGILIADIIAGSEISIQVENKKLILGTVSDKKDEHISFRNESNVVFIIINSTENNTERYQFKLINQ